MPAENGTIIVYRAASRFGRPLTLHILVDGAERATIRGSQKAQIDLAEGPHAVSARYRSMPTPDLSITVTAGQRQLIVLDVVARTPDPTSAATTGIVLRETNVSDEKATAPNGGYVRPGNPRSPLEQGVYVVGIACLFVGLAISHSGRPVGLIFSSIGAIITVVFFFRRFLYRD